MGAYSYRALNESGKTVRGILDGDSERHVRSLLRAKKFKPLEVTSVASQTREDTRGGLFAWRGRRGGRLSARDLSLVTRKQTTAGILAGLARSEEHTSELQSRGHLVCRLLLEKNN